MIANRSSKVNNPVRHVSYWLRLHLYISNINLSVSGSRISAGVAKQGGVVAGQRCDHQHRRIVLHVHDVALVGVALEARQSAERLLDTVFSITGKSWPATSREWMSNAGFS